MLYIRIMFFFIYFFLFSFAQWSNPYRFLLNFINNWVVIKFKGQANKVEAILKVKSALLSHSGKYKCNTNHPHYHNLLVKSKINEYDSALPFSEKDFIEYDYTSSTKLSTNNNHHLTNKSIDDPQSGFKGDSVRFMNKNVNDVLTITENSSFEKDDSDDDDVSINDDDDNYSHENIGYEKSENDFMKNLISITGLDLTTTISSRILPTSTIRIDDYSSTVDYILAKEENSIIYETVGTTKMGEARFL